MEMRVTVFLEPGPRTPVPLPPPLLPSGSKLLPDKDFAPSSFARGRLFEIFTGDLSELAKSAVRRATPLSATPPFSPFLLSPSVLFPAKSLISPPSVAVTRRSLGRAVFVQ